MAALKPRHFIELLALAALWGAAFLFMRVSAPEFGPVALSFLRVALAALVLAPLVWWQRLGPVLVQHWKAIAVVGVVNSALPFLAYTYAALHINAGLAAVLNATAPLWAAVIAWFWFGERPGAVRLLGLAIGLAGVVWLVSQRAGLQTTVVSDQTLGAIVACLGATWCYGLAANLTKRYLTDVAPLALAAGSQIAATLALSVPAWALWPTHPASATAWASVLALGLLCTGAAYWMFFRLIARVGPARAIAVTFLIPAFALLWAGLFLGERLTAVLVLACAVILIGTALATRKEAARVPKKQWR